MDSDPGTNVLGTPMSAPGKKSKLGLILGLSIGGGALIIGSLILVLLLVLGGGVSKQDFAEAYQKTETMSASYNKISTYVTTYYTETEIRNNLDTLKNNLAAFNDSYKEVGDTKAVKNDKEAKDLYQKIADRKAKFDEAIDAMIEVYEKILPAIVTMKDDYSVTNYNDLVVSYQKVVEAMDGVKSSVNKDFVDSLSSIVVKMKPVAVKRQAGIDDYKKYDSNASTQWYALEKEWRDATTDWQSNFEKLANDGELKDQIYALSGYLFNKQFDRN
jgi:hypothetical protein